MTGVTLILADRPLSWYVLFGIGIAGMMLVAIKAWPSASSAIYQPPTSAAVPSPAPIIATASRAAPASPPTATKIIQALPPVGSFTPSHIAPADLPPELAGLSRPPPDPVPWVAPIGVQPGYRIPEDPQPRDIR